VPSLLQSNALSENSKCFVRATRGRGAPAKLALVSTSKSGAQGGCFAAAPAEILQGFAHDFQHQKSMCAKASTETEHCGKSQKARFCFVCAKTDVHSGVAFSSSMVEQIGRRSDTQKSTKSFLHDMST